VIQYESVAEHIRNNKEKMLGGLLEAFKRAGDISALLEEFINAGFDFAQLLQKQKSIYYFRDLSGEFDAGYMDFQDPWQDEFLRDNRLEPQDVLISFYPAFIKMTSSELFPIVMSKGKALCSPLERK